MDDAPILVIVGDDDSSLRVYVSDDGTATVVVLKKRGSTKFTCRGSDYVAAHHKAFPAQAGPAASGDEAPRTRIAV